MKDMLIKDFMGFGSWTFSKFQKEFFIFMYFIVYG